MFQNYIVSMLYTTKDDIEGARALGESVTD